MGWEDLSEEERKKAEGSIANARRRIKEVYSGRGFLRFYERAERLMKKLEREFPEAKDLVVRANDIREEVLTRLLKVMYLNYGIEEFVNKAVEWLNEHGEPVEVVFRTGKEDNIYEKQLYNKVAEYLINKEIHDEEYQVYTCRQPNPLRWGNPDVVLIKKNSKGKPTEVIVAEVKNTQEIDKLYKGFGQACAYKLFSHVQYLVIPKLDEAKTFKHLSKLCYKMGINLVVFTFKGDKKNLNHVQFDLIKGSKFSEPPDEDILEEFLEKLGVEA